MNKEYILRLLKEEGYPTFMLETTINKINNFDPRISAIFKDWFQNGVIPQLDICGYTYTKLTSQYNMKPVGAFITLDWLLREPDKASYALQKGKK